MASTNDLVPESAATELAELDKQLKDAQKKMSKMLGTAVYLKEALSAQATSYSELSSAIKSYNELEDKAIKVIKDYNKAVGEREKLRKQVLEIDSKEMTALQRREKLERDHLKTEAQKQKTLQETEKQEQQAIKTGADLRKAERERIKTEQQATKLAEQQARASKKEQDAQNSAADSINRKKQELAKLVIEYNRADEAARKKLAPSIKKLQEEINKANAEIGRSQGYVGRYTESLMNFAKKIGVVALVTKGFQMLGNAIKEGVKTMIEFEKANSNLAAILGTNLIGVRNLTAEAMRLGAATRFTASEVTALQTELAKLGFTQKEIKNSTESVLLFSQATGAGLAEAASLTGATLRMFNASTKETDRYVSAMAIGTNKSALSFSYLNTAMSTVGPVANAFGFTIEDTIALLGKLSDAGFDASAAATATRNILLNLADANGALAKKIGGPVKTIPELVQALVKLREGGVDLSETLDLTDKRSVAVFNAFLTAAEGIEVLRGQVTGVTGELKEMADTMNDNVEGSIKMMESAWEGFVLKFRGSFLGVIRPLIDWWTGVLGELNEFVDLNSGNIQNSKIFGKVVDETKKDEEDILRRIFEEKINEGYDISLIYKIKNAEIKKYLKEAEDDLDAFMKKQGIFQKFFYSSKADNEKENRLKLIVETTKASLEALENVYDEFAKKQKEFEEDTKGTKGTKKLTDKEKEELKKRADEEKKAAQDLALFLIGEESEKNKRILEDNKKAYEERITALDTFVETQMESIRKSAEFQLSNDKLTASGRQLVKEKETAELLKLQQEQERMQLSITKDYVEKQQKIIEAAAKVSQDKITEDEARAIQALKDQYLAGEIAYEKYEEEKLATIKEYGEKRIDAELESFELLKDIAGLTAEQEEEFERKLQEARVKYVKQANGEIAKEYDKLVKDKQKSDEEDAQNEERAAKRMKELQMDLAAEASDFLFQLIDARFERQLEDLDRQSEANDEWRDRELTRIEEQENAGIISKENADAQKAFIDVESQRRDNELEQKKKEILQRQAKYEKAQAMISIAISTAQAIMRAYSDAGPIFGIPLAIAVGAIGAVQLAAVAAKPIPEYEEGTDYHTGGPALLGEKRREMVILPSGDSFITPNSPTIFDLPRGTEVLPDLTSLYAREAARIPKAEDRPIQIQFDASEIIRSQNEMRDELRSFKNEVSCDLRRIRANSAYATKLSNASAELAKRKRGS
jgi:TP901 family phage tail tape measure protein